ISGSTEYQSKARKRLQELARKKQRTLTMREIDAALNNISPSLKRTFKAYCRGGTVNASDLKNSMWEQHPSTDDGFYEQWMSNDHMDRFAGSPDQDPALICEKE